MSRRALSSRHSIDSCTIKLHSWRPFRALDSSDYPHTPPPKPYSASSNGAGSGAGFHPKRPCLSDRTTAPFVAADTIDLSRLSLFDEDRPMDAAAAAAAPKRGSLRLIQRKRRRRGSRSVSGRSSDRSGTRRCCSVGASAAYGTCSDIQVAIATDSSGELFGNGDWGSDASEARNSRRDRDGGASGGSGERENLISGFGQVGNFDTLANESGYGSEPGYRGDAEFGYGDEVDEEEDDPKVLFWGDQFGDTDSNMEMVGENTFSDQKSHHRCRRKKHDCKMGDPSR